MEYIWLIFVLIDVTMGDRIIFNLLKSLKLSSIG